MSHGFHDEGEGDLLLVRDTPGRERTITLDGHLEGRRLLVSANAEDRAADAERLIAQALPDARLIEHDQRTFAESMGEHDAHDDDDDWSGGGRELVLPGRSPDDPELVAMLTRDVRDHVASGWTSSWTTRAGPG